MTKTTIGNVELFNRIRRLRREAEKSYRAGRWQDGWILEGEANRAEDGAFASAAGSGNGSASVS